MVRPRRWFHRRLDTVKTPRGRTRRPCSAVPPATPRVGASFFTPGSISLAWVGDDFPARPTSTTSPRARSTLAGLQTVPGKTFRWSGRNTCGTSTPARTRSVELNVFEHFNPHPPPPPTRPLPICSSRNIGPNLQNHVLDQMTRPPLRRRRHHGPVDRHSRADELLRPSSAASDMLILNDGEARQLTKETSLIRAGGPASAPLGPKIRRH